MNTRLRDIFMKFDSLSRSGIHKFRPSLMLKISNEKWVKLKCYRFSEVLWFKFPGRIISQSFKIFEAKIHLLETAISKVFFEECLHSNSKVKLGNQIFCILYILYILSNILYWRYAQTFFFQENSITLPEFTAFYQNILPWPEAITLKLFLRFVKKQGSWLVNITCSSSDG